LPCHLRVMSLNIGQSGLSGHAQETSASPEKDSNPRPSDP
jgi:hypothetical protein